jgi:hypothetical protein
LPSKVKVFDLAFIDGTMVTMKCTTVDRRFLIGGVVFVEPFVHGLGVAAMLWKCTKLNI